MTSTPQEAATVASHSLHLEVFTSPTRQIGDSDRTFSPITSTLVYGDTDAVLVDAQFITDDVDALGDMIEQTGRNLRTIFITHGHGDHYWGADRLAARFGGAQTVTTPAIADHISAHLERDIATWTPMFPGALTVPTTVPKALADASLTLEGYELPVIEVPQGDIAPCAVLHVPPLRAVIAGDVAYNQIHQMLGFAGPAEWEAWTASVDAIEQLDPDIVIAGHKKPEAPDTAGPVMDSTRAYIRDFAAAASTATSAADIITTMTAKYPDHGNLTTLLFSADAAMRSKAAASTAAGT